MGSVVLHLQMLTNANKIVPEIGDQDQYQKKILLVTTRTLSLVKQ